ncbi:MAG: hypothetical protein K8F27_13580 [Sulfuricellaceae bacterium]|nr:hypothetical protein [Sulfuricellaceae bacterium]
MTAIKNALAASLLLAAALAPPPSLGAEREAVEGVVFSVSVRTAEQIRAFYSARGFPEAALKELDSRCFLGVGVRNGRADIVWLEPAKWRIAADTGEAVKRIGRDEWHGRWAQLDVPLASRATFGWSQLPESRDLLAGETVGGNVAVAPPSGPFSVEAVFATGADRSGPTLRIKVPNLKCGPPPGDRK